MEEIEVFDRTQLKSYFYNFASITVVLALFCIGITFLLPRLFDEYQRYTSYSWLIFLVGIGVSIFFDRKNKKGLRKLTGENNIELVMEGYSKLYQQRLIANGFSIFLTGIILIANHKKLFLVLLIFQLVLIPTFFPRKAFISKELNREDLIFN